MSALRRVLVLGVLSGVAILAVSTGAARAGLMVTATNVAPITPDRLAGDYRYTYEVDLTSREKIVKGDFFTLYDFTGLVRDTVDPIDGDLQLYFTIAVQDLGKTAPHISIVDNPKVPNITLIYSYPSKKPIQGDTILGHFSAVSKFGPAADILYGGQTHVITTGGPAWEVGVTQGPDAVPEPASLALIGIGIVTMAGYGWRRRKLGAA